MPLQKFLIFGALQECSSIVTSFIHLVFLCEIDVQIGNGRLNYINGYVAKDHDAVDVGLGEYVQRNATGAWLATYRLLSKSTPCIPEIAIRMAQLTEFEKSYSHVLLYPPQPAAMVDFSARQGGNFSAKMYGFYLQQNHIALDADVPIAESFLVWHRSRQYDSQKECWVFRGGQHQRIHTQTLVVACRYWYELTDGYVGQFALTMLPHRCAKDILPRVSRHLESMQNFAGVLEYLSSWRYAGDRCIKGDKDVLFRCDALPMIVSDCGRIESLVGREDSLVFPNRTKAHSYLVLAMKRDLQYRGFRDDRLVSFELKMDANLVLQLRVERAADEIEYERLRQEWDHINRPKHRDLQWSKEQAQVLEIVREGISMEDEERRLSSRRWLFIKGNPGSGKTAILLALALEACKQINVLIVCPTGYLVHKYKSMLPELDGVENIRVDTIQSVLKYKRKGADSRVRWTPPSALRRIDLVLIDEGSQYENLEWERFFSSIKEQPHKPFVAIAADFQQLSPVVSGGLCEAFCNKMESVELKTVYRSTDPEHLVFLNRIRVGQPDRETLKEYFGDRHWKNESLEDCVQRGMDIARSSGDPFVWLTSTNYGAAEVSRAALRCLNVHAHSVIRMIRMKSFIYHCFRSCYTFI